MYGSRRPYYGGVVNPYGEIIPAVPSYEAPNPVPSTVTVRDDGSKKGDKGDTGRGIQTTTVNGAGHLLLTYTDGAVIDVGVVVGAGIVGRGIQSSAINGAGRLILTYTDATTVDAGLVVGTAGTPGTPGSAGAAGRGVQSVAVNGSNRIIVTYTDATTVDAGPLPAASVTAAALSAVAATLPTTPPAGVNQPWLDGGVLVFTTSA